MILCAFIVVGNLFHISFLSIVYIFRFNEPALNNRVNF